VISKNTQFAKSLQTRIIKSMSLLNRPFEFLQRHGGRMWLWWAMPVALHLWTLSIPFVFDDMYLVNRAERYWAGSTSEWELFRFAPDETAWRSLRSRGTVPWWAHESTRIDFFRPLPSASVISDVRLLGRNPMAHHAASLALFALVLPCVFSALRAAGAAPVHAGLATFFLGISQTLAQPVGIIANRSDLFMLLGLALATRAWWQARTRASWSDAILGGLGLVVALLSKEPAAVFVVVIAVDAILTRPLSAGRKRLLPVFVLLAGAYLGFYLYSRGYAMLPASDAPSNLPSIALALWNLPLYLSVWTVGFPIGALLQDGIVVPVAVRIIGIVTTLTLLPAMLRLQRGRPAVRFFLVWAAAYAAFALLTLPESRALSVATLGWSFILVALILPVPLPPRESVPALASTDFRTRPMLRHMLLCANGIVSVVCGVATLVVMERGELNAQASLVAGVDIEKLDDGDAVIIRKAKSPFELLCAGDRLEFLSGCSDLSVAFLETPDLPIRVEMPNDKTLVMTAPPPGPLGAPAHSVLLGRRFKPTVGRAFKLRDFTATIDAVDAGGHASALTLRFNDSLIGGRIHYVSPPEPRGRPDDRVAPVAQR